MIVRAQDNDGLAAQLQYQLTVALRGKSSFNHAFKTVCVKFPAVAWSRRLCFMSMPMTTVYRSMGLHFATPISRIVFVPTMPARMDIQHHRSKSTQRRHKRGLAVVLVGRWSGANRGRSAQSNMWNWARLTGGRCAHSCGRQGTIRASGGGIHRAPR